MKDWTMFIFHDTIKKYELAEAEIGLESLIIQIGWWLLVVQDFWLTHSYQPDIDKTYLYAKDPYGTKQLMLIIKREK